MSTRLKSEGRRFRLPLITSLAVALSAFFGMLAMSAGHPRPVEARVLSVSTATPAPPVAAEETSNETVGCGCAESCLAAD